MSPVPMEIVPDLGRDDQVGLRMRCINDMQAEAIYRALREQFPRISRLMASFHLDYTHHVYVSAPEDTLRRVWTDIVAAVERSGAVAVTQPPASTTTRPAHQTIEDFAAWRRRFGQAVKRVHDEIPHQSVAVQEISLGWVEEQIQAGNIAEVEARLLQQSQISGSSSLRAQIALYSRTRQIEKVIALYEAQRDDVLALPVSGSLAEQLVGAYLEFAGQSGSADALRTAYQIAQAFLPELERLRQAAGVRSLLQEALRPSESSEMPPVNSDDSSGKLVFSLSEQIAQIVQVEPAEQLTDLQKLNARHPQALGVQLALAAAHAELGEAEQALELYDAIPADAEERVEARRGAAHVLLSAGRYAELLDLVPSDEEDARLLGLRGAALYWLGRKGEASVLLERAWDASERDPAILLPLARSRLAAGSLELALAPYHILLDTAPGLLEAQDYAQIAVGTYLNNAGDVSQAQIAALCDRYVELGGASRNSDELAADILKLRVDLRVAGEDGAWRASYADWLEWLARAGDVAGLEAALGDLRDRSGRHAISREEHFALLESVEPYGDALPQLGKALTNEYQNIVGEELRATLRHNLPLPAYVRDVQRALHFLSRADADLLAEYIEQERRDLAERNQPVPDQVVEEEPALDLAHLRLALVGGHDATRRGVERELRERYGLQSYVEIAPSSEEHVDRGRVLARISGSDLIAVITGYTGHDLTNIVRDLKQAGALGGEVIWLSCRGKSGVVREIVSVLRQR